MHRCSESIGAIAAALAKAQGELTNPEKSLVGTIRFPLEGERTFRYASLASGLDIVRKSLGQHEIATIQTTAIDQGRIRLTTLLAHASGEWISSDWPVCPISDTAHRMGAALTYARRYALFALVGIAGEDDLDAPDLLSDPAHAVDAPVHPGPPNSRKPPNGSLHKPPILAAEPSAILRDQLVAEIETLKDGEALALWAHCRLPAKNMLTAVDAGTVEAACQIVLDALANDTDGLSESPTPANAGDSEDPTSAEPPEAKQSVTPLRKELRHRNKAHLAFVAAQPCLICRRSPCDAHHLKFAQPNSLGRKVSDQFTVPLCRDHHSELHRHGNERAWWANLQIDAIQQAEDLWRATLRGDAVSTGPHEFETLPSADHAKSNDTLGRTSR
jgi:hypothetical protein